MIKPRKRKTILFRPDAEKIFEAYKIISAAYSHVVHEYFMDDKSQLCAALSNSLLIMQNELNDGGFHIVGALGKAELEYDGVTHEA